MSKRKRHLEGEIGAFVQQYGRKANPNIDPNDRRYDRKVEEMVKRMRPEELDELLHGSEYEDLNKDPAILELLADLREALGAALFIVVDHWEADLCAVGVAHPRNQHVLASLALTETLGRYDIHLEFPAPEGSELPYRSVGDHSNVEFAEAVEIVRGHLRRSAEQIVAGDVRPGI